MAIKVLNSSPIFRVVDVVDINTDKKTSVNLQPRGRVDLPEHLMVDPKFEADPKNRDIKIFEVV